VRLVKDSVLIRDEMRRLARNRNGVTIRTMTKLMKKTGSIEHARLVVGNREVDDPEKVHRIHISPIVTAAAARL
jgi:hypothetical protein